MHYGVYSRRYSENYMRRSLLKLSALIAAIVLTTCFLYLNSERVSYLREEISYGTTTNVSLAPDSPVTADLSVKHNDTHGLSLYFWYPEGTVIDGKAVELTLESDSRTLHVSVPFIRMGYVGDSRNEGPLFFDFKEGIPVGDYRVTLRPDGISEADGIALELRPYSSLSSAVTMEGTDGQKLYLYGTVHYSSMTSRNGRILLIGSFCVLLSVLYYLLKQYGTVPAKAPEPHVSETFRPSFTWRSAVSLLLLLVLEAVFMEYTWHSSVRPALDSENTPVKDGRTSAELAAGDGLSWDLSDSVLPLSAVGLSFDCTYQEDLALTLKITDRSTGETLSIRNMDFGYLRKDSPDGPVKILLDEPVLTEGRRLSASLTCESASGPVSVAMSKKEGTPFYSVYYREFGFLKKAFLGFCFLIAFGTIILWLMTTINVPSGILYASVLLFSLFLFTVLIKPFSVPDEIAHFDTAYRVSNSILGLESSPYQNTLLKRQCDLLPDPVSFIRVSAASFARMKEDLLRTGISRELVLTTGRDLRSDSSYLFYLPAALGITLARLLGLGLIATVFLARGANIISAVFLLVLASRKIPYKKTLLIACSCMPMALQEIGSVAPDALLIPLGFLLIACDLSILSDPENASPADLTLAAAVSGVLCLGKAAAYSPLAVLTLFAGIRYLKTHFSGKALRTAKLGIALSAALAVFAVRFYFGYSISRLFDASSASFVSRRNTDIYTLSYLVTHPEVLLRLLENTFYVRVPGLIVNLAGQSLCMIGNVNLNRLIQYSYLLLLFYTCLTGAEERFRETFRWKERLLSLTLPVLSFGIFMVVMVTGQTKFGTDYITGLQVRYFLPCLPLFLAGLSPAAGIPGDGRKAETAAFRFLTALSAMAALSFITGIAF